MAKKLFYYLSMLVYLIVSLSLLALSMVLVFYALWEVGVALHTGTEIVSTSLDAIGLIVISMAVFDIARYLYEEEVVRDRELRSATEARRTLTKFQVIITIAVSLEALVFIFAAGSTDVQTLIYPTALLVAAVILMVGLGWYQRLSTGAEHEGAGGKERS